MLLSLFFGNTCNTFLCLDIMSSKHTVELGSMSCSAKRPQCYSTCKTDTHHCTLYYNNTVLLLEVSDQLLQAEVYRTPGRSRDAWTMCAVQGQSAIQSMYSLHLRNETFVYKWLLLTLAAETAKIYGLAGGCRASCPEQNCFLDRLDLSVTVCCMICIHYTLCNPTIGWHNDNNTQ